MYAVNQHLYLLNKLKHKSLDNIFQAIRVSCMPCQLTCKYGQLSQSDTGHLIVLFRQVHTPVAAYWSNLHCTPVYRQKNINCDKQ